MEVIETFNILSHYSVQITIHSVLKHQRAFGWYHTGALGLIERSHFADLSFYRGPEHLEGPYITKLSSKVPNHFFASIVWHCLWEMKLVDPLSLSHGNRISTCIPTTIRVAVRKARWSQPNDAPLHPADNFSIIQTTTEAELLAQITAFPQDMARLQEHNNFLSSKVDETQQLLNQQQT